MVNVYQYIYCDCDEVLGNNEMIDDENHNIRQWDCPLRVDGQTISPHSSTFISKLKFLFPILWTESFPKNYAFKTT